MKNKHIAWLSLFVLLITFGIDVSFAQVQAISDLNTTPSDTDVSLNLLYRIIGDPSSEMGHPVIGQAFAVMNAGIMVLATIMFLYTVLTGILHTAEDGEFLGRNWSSHWVPFRFAMGIIFLVPLANGFSLSQKAVIWVGEQGIGFANVMLKSTVDALVDSQGNMVAVRLAEDGSIKNVMRQILKSEACNIDMSSKYDAIFGVTLDTANSGGGGRFVWGPLSANRGTEIPTTSFPNDVCGALAVPSIHSLSNANNPFTAFIGRAMDIGSGVWSGSKDANAAIQAAQYEALRGSVEMLRPVAQRIASRGEQTATDQEIIAVIDRATEYYISNIGNVVQRAVQTQNQVLTNSFKADVKETGWIGFGAWYYQMARINSELNRMSSLVPEFTEATIGSDDGSSGLDPALSIRVDKVVLQNVSNDIGVVDRRSEIDSVNGGLSGALDDLSNGAVNSASKPISEMFSIDPTNPTNALVQLKNVGDYLLGGVEAVLLGGMVADAIPAGNLIGKVKGVAVEASKTAGGALGSVWPFSFFKKFITKDVTDFAKYIAFFGLISLLGFAIVLAFWIPISAFVIWMGSVLGWLISFIEMIVAAPIWFAAHMHPDGRGMSGEYGRAGYMLLAEVFCRPLLMVIGLIVSISIIDPFLRFASAIYFNAFQTVTADSFSGIVTLLATIFIYVGFCLGLVNRCFAIIHIFPNSVLRWVSIHSSGHDQGDAADREIHGTVLAYFNRAQGVGQQTAGAANRSKQAREVLKKESALGQSRQPNRNQDNQ